MTHQKECPGSSPAAKLGGYQGTTALQTETILALPGIGCKFLRPARAGETHGE